MEEVWKDIQLGNSKYKISNLGNIYSYFAKRNMSKNKDRRGYLYISTTNKKYKIHRLVAQAFIPNPNNYPIINHKDNNPSNNKVDNLEWCTYKYNIDYCIKSGRFEEAKKKISKACKEKKAYIKNLKIASEKNKKAIFQYDLNGNFIKEWDCSATVEKELGLFATSIIKVCKNKGKTCGNFIWRYKEDKNVKGDF